MKIQMKNVVKYSVKMTEKKNEVRILLTCEAGIMGMGILMKHKHCKKGYRFSRPQSGCHLPNSPWAGIIGSEDRLLMRQMKREKRYY
jgi:hypothetical protein